MEECSILTSLREWLYSYNDEKTETRCHDGCLSLHFIRRTNEEMVRFDGSRIFPSWVSDTLGFELSKGTVSEEALYNETTEYIREFYNKARILNRSAARFAMSIFQRCLASSTLALLRSFERRLAKLDELIERIESGRVSKDELWRGLSLRMVLDEKTGDEETSVVKPIFFGIRYTERIPPLS